VSLDPTQLCPERRIDQFAAVHGTFMSHTYNFFMPNLSSGYPVVDGPLSITTYLSTLDNAYKRYKEKYTKQTALTQGINGINAANGDCENRILSLN